MLKRLVCVFALLTLALTFAAAQTSGLSIGVGHSSLFRLGPGKDSAGAQVYSINYVYAAVVFDAKGRIVDVQVDALEVSTPNYDGASMPHFSGWPGGPALNLVDHASKKVSGTAPATPEAVTAEVASWKSKRDRGDQYGMNAKNDWFKQMDAFQKLFIGKTVDEVDTWLAAYTSDVNGRILNPGTTNEKDKAKVDKLSAADKQMLVDARSSATMSVNDAHGNIVSAIRDAFAKRRPMAAGK
jgi:hypothetical protein